MGASRKDEETTVRELVERVARFRDSRDWRKYDTPRNLAGSICIEAAELPEHFQWKTDEQAAEMLDQPEQLERISNELADVVIYCLGFSDILSIDVSNAVYRKLQKNAEKYPPKAQESRRGSKERDSTKNVRST
jgi:NTP pyrophosphatase (non-canonical NTP hydrolase)